MRGRRFAAVAGAVAAAVATTWLFPAPSQGDPLSASVTRTGWWSQQPGAQAQGNGGFQVAEAAQQPQSVAAVEVSIGDAVSVSTATLKLTESGALNADNAALNVCTTFAGWKDANPGAWADQPPADCSAAVHLKRDAASTSWTGDVSALVHPGAVIDLMIVPVPQPVGGVVDPGFQITVAKAEVTADGTTSASSSFSTTGGGSSFNAPPSSDSSSSGSSFSAPADSSSSGSFGPTSSSGFNATAPSPASPPASVAPALPAPAPAAAPASAPTAPGGSFSASGVGHHSRPWWRLIVFVPLAALVGLGAAVARNRFPSLAT